MMTMAEYLRKNHSNLSVEVRNLVEDTVSAINFTLPGIERENLAKKQMFINHALDGMGFEDFELEAFAQDRVPVTMVTLPVNIDVPRYYRIYLRVPENVEPEEARQAAMDYIVENGLNDDDIDSEIDEPANDGRMTITVDWDGMMYD